MELRMTLCKVEFFCDDRKVGQALRALVGLAQGAPTVQPVVNTAVQGNGSVTAATGGKAIDMFSAWLKDTKLELVRARDVREFCRQHSLSSYSTSYIIKQAIDIRLLKRVRGTATSNAAYHVVQQ
jgi:hypothetical protein